MSTATAFADQLARLEPPVGDSSSFAPSPAAWKSCESTGDTAQAVDVTILAPRSDWLVAAFRKLAKLSTLRTNWDSYGADAPSIDAIASARRVLGVLLELDLEPTSVDPSAEGGICISFTTKNRYGDIECFNSRQILAVTSAVGDEPNVWRVESDDEVLRGAVATIKSFIER